MLGLKLMHVSKKGPWCLQMLFSVVYQHHHWQLFLLIPLLLQRGWALSFIIGVFSKVSILQTSSLGTGKDYSWWRLQIKTHPALLALCEGNHRSPVDSPHNGKWRGALMSFLIGAWKYGWANNRHAGDLRRHHAHYNIIVICWWKFSGLLLFIVDDDILKKRWQLGPVSI